MARKEYISSDERVRFDSPPQLQEVNILIQTPHWAETYLESLGRIKRIGVIFLIAGHWE